MIRRRHIPTGLAAAALAAAWGCSGPQPLSTAIRPADEAAYAAELAGHPDSPRQAWFAWKAAANGQPAAALAEQDAALSTTRNPFDARHDPAAVSRGAVIYKAHCVQCHGERVDGVGPGMPKALPAMDFHAFSKRFAVTLHRGAPRAWFAKISDGFTSEVTTDDGQPITMPAFRDVLAREQIWLAITYLQSLDADAVPVREDAGS